MERLLSKVLLPLAALLALAQLAQGGPLSPEYRARLSQAAEHAAQARYDQAYQLCADAIVRRAGSELDETEVEALGSFYDYRLTATTQNGQVCACVFNESAVAADDASCLPR